MPSDFISLRSRFRYTSVIKIACAAKLEVAMREPHDETPDAPVDWDPEPEARRDTDEARNFEKEVSDTGADYDAGFDENMTPLDESEEINEHGSER